MHKKILELILNQTVFNRYFELQVVENYNRKLVRPPIYLSVGTEHIPPIILAAFKKAGFSLKDFALFTQHRCHSYYLTFGGDPTGLAFELCGSEKGCNGGMGGSASLSNNESANFYGHSGLLGDQVPISVGYAHASQQHTLVIMGDAAAEEDYALGALGYAATKNVPILFICEDNDLSILTPKKIRRSWKIEEVAKGFGIDSYGIRDTPNDIFDLINLFIEKKQPMLVNVECQRHLWHAGAGVDSAPIWDTYANLIKICREVMGSNVDTIINEQSNKALEIWEKVIDEIEGNN